MLKDKRVIWGALAFCFVAVIFVSRYGLPFSKNNSLGLEVDVGNEKLVDLVNKDTDDDGIFDWEEKLFGTDPLIKDTDGDGIEDSVEIAETRETQIKSGDSFAGTTATDKFSQELFATVAALSQGGQLDEVTVDALSQQLVEQIVTSSPAIVYTTKDLRTTTVNNKETFQEYNEDLNEAYKKYPSRGNALQILEQFIGDGENVDTSALLKLTPIIEQLESFSKEIMKVAVPTDLAKQHLSMANGLTRLADNLRNVQKFDSDVVIAMGAIGQYEANMDLANSAIEAILDLLNKKLSS